MWCGLENWTHQTTYIDLSNCFLYLVSVILNYISFKRSFFTTTFEETKSIPHRKNLCRFSKADSS